MSSIKRLILNFIHWHHQREWFPTICGPRKKPLFNLYFLPFLELVCVCSLQWKCIAKWFGLIRWFCDLTNYENPWDKKSLLHRFRTTSRFEVSDPDEISTASTSSNIVTLLKHILINLRNTAVATKANNDEPWVKRDKQVLPVKKSLDIPAAADNNAEQDDDFTNNRDSEGVRTSRSESRFLQIQGLDNHLAHMSRPR